MQRATPFAVFLLGALTIGFAAFGQVTAAVWGAPTHPLQYVALYSSLTLLISAFVCLFAPASGRVFATISILGMGALCIPAAASLVPAATRTVSPMAGLLVAGYFALLAFALFFPTRWRVSVPLFVGCLLASGAFATTTYIHRKEQGELRWPAFVFLEWTPASGALQVTGDPEGWLTAEDQRRLTTHGVTGALRWSGSQGYSADLQRVIVICQSRIPAPQQLHYPKQGTVFYIFDGKEWKTIPERPEVYPAHATLNPDGGLEQVTTSGGTQRVVPFRW